MWLVRESKILTKDNLAKRGWTGDQTCHFCNFVETINHFFVTCHIISTLWSWIANHNYYFFNCERVSDLWLLDTWIPLKNSLLIKLIRAVTIWVVWLARNRVCLNDAEIPSLASLGSQIIYVTSYWCKSNSNDSFFLN